MFASDTRTFFEQEIDDGGGQYINNDLAIFERPISYHTHKGDIVYEPFSGSGSQIIAAERHGRRCFAMELEPAFVDVAVARWEKFTGGKAIKGKAADEHV